MSKDEEIDLLKRQVKQLQEVCERLQSQCNNNTPMPEDDWSGLHYESLPPWITE